MATYTPPPYFPQASLAPPDPNRYRKLKLVLVLVGIFALALLGVLGLGIWYLLKWAL